MKLSRNKIVTVSIVFVLMLTMTVSLVAIPNVNAQPTRTGVKTVYPYLDTIPNPVGVNQETLLFFGITDQADRPQDGWPGITITVTKPDGTLETLGPFRTDSTGGTGRIYVPDQVGTYTLVMNFPEYTVEGRVSDFDAGTLLKAATSDVLELVVQQEPLAYYPGFQLPQEYWTRPIDAQIREWSTISGSWLNIIAYDRLAPYNDGPETPHVLWTKPLSMGGLIGGEYGGLSYVHGDAYEGQFSGSCIISGILYYNTINVQNRGLASVEGQHVVAVNLHTGEELWRKQLLDPVDGSVQSIDFGQIYHWDSFNHHGAYSYLWATTGSTWNAYDAFTGEWAYTYTNVPSGTNIVGPQGEIIKYTINLEEGWMTKWNSELAVNPQNAYHSNDGSWGRYMGIDKPHIVDRIVNATATGFEWNVTIPTNLPGRVKLNLNDRIVGGTTNRDWFADFDHTFWGISTAPGTEGQLLFKTTWTPPDDSVQYEFRPLVHDSRYFEDGVFVIAAKDVRQFYGFSIDTGEYLWGPTTPQLPFLDSMTMIYANMAWGQTSIAYGKLFAAGMGGRVAAYDIKTGENLWEYDALDPYSEILWANRWPSLMMIITDGKLYLDHAEHSVIDPRPRGAPFLCLNATTGEVIWRADGLLRTTRWGGQVMMADSIIAAFDTYSNLIFALGKGPTATTVSAPDTAQPLGTPVLLKGTITDISPGTNDPALKMRFPNGVGAVANEDMDEWMLYVYKQMTFPKDAEGVEVVLSVLDPNNNYYEVGRTTSDASGMYKKAFIPPVPGEYTVMATFEGTEGYWPSQALTAIFVSEAPSPAQPIEPEPTTPEPTTPEPTTPEPTTPEPTTPEPTTPEPTEPEPTEPAEAPLITTEVAIIAAVIVASIIGVVSFWALRKRK